MSVELEVDDEDAGCRLDVMLVRRVEGMSRARARRMIQDGDVRLNGRTAKKGARLDVGDHVVLERMPAPRDFVAPLAPDVPLTVCYEDEHLVVVDKPAGLPTHPLRIDDGPTLAGALLARYPEMEGVGYALREPGILHRLDNETSGLLMAARSAEVFERLREALKAGRIDKRYLALVPGEVSECRSIDFPIARHPTDPRRVHACVDPVDRRLPAARPAVTEILSVRPTPAGSLLEIRATVAVRHQIRAHLASIGHPLVGDWLYGGPTVEGLTRHFLHAFRLELTHPETGQPLRVESELPPELSAILDGGGAG